MRKILTLLLAIAFIIVNAAISSELNPTGCWYDSYDSKYKCPNIIGGIPSSCIQCGNNISDCDCFPEGSGCCCVLNTGTGLTEFVAVTSNYQCTDTLGGDWSYESPCGCDVVFGCCCKDGAEISVDPDDKLQDCLDKGGVWNVDCECREGLVLTWDDCLAFNYSIHVTDTWYPDPEGCPYPCKANTSASPDPATPSTADPYHISYCVIMSSPPVPPCYVVVEDINYSKGDYLRHIFDILYYLERSEPCDATLCGNVRIVYQLESGGAWINSPWNPYSGQEAMHISLDCNPLVCNDSDEDSTYPFEVAGNTSLGGSIFYDSCINHSFLQEYYCFDNEVKNVTHFCGDGYGCKDRKCTNATCSGGAVDYYVRKSVTFEGETYNDSCVSDTILKELNCTNPFTLSYGNYDCSSEELICEDGKCVAYTPPVCTDSDGMNLLTKGTVTLNGYSVNDSCVSDQVKEWFCNSSGSPNFDLLNCTGTQTCDDGKCVIDECIDYDEGLPQNITPSYAVKYNFTTSTYDQFDDYCSGDNLVEYACNGDNLVSQTIDCGSEMLCMLSADDRGYCGSENDSSAKINLTIYEGTTPILGSAIIKGQHYALMMSSDIIVASIKISVLDIDDKEAIDPTSATPNAKTMTFQGIDFEDLDNGVYKFNISGTDSSKNIITNSNLLQLKQFMVIDSYLPEPEIEIYKP